MGAAGEATATFPPLLRLSDCCLWLTPFTVPAGFPVSPLVAGNCRLYILRDLLVSPLIHQSWRADLPQICFAPTLSVCACLCICSPQWLSESTVSCWSGPASGHHHWLFLAGPLGRASLSVVCCGFNFAPTVLVCASLLLESSSFPRRAARQGRPHGSPHCHDFRFAANFAPTVSICACLGPASFSVRCAAGPGRPQCWFAPTMSVCTSLLPASPPQYLAGLSSSVPHSSCDTVLSDFILFY